MCTVTIHHGTDRVTVTMNRDERRDRAPESPPGAMPTATPGITMLAPRDGGTGGTWIGVNSRGLVAALLNGYAPADAAMPAGGAASRPSRGFLVPGALAQGSLQDAAAWAMNAINPQLYASFTLLLVGLGGGFRIEWPGGAAGRLAIEPILGQWNFSTSSGWNTGQVLAWRRGLFDAWIQHGSPFVGYLPELHVHRVEGYDAWCPLMAGPESATRSITQATVHRGTTAEMLYWPQPAAPHAGMPESTVRLALD